MRLLTQADYRVVPWRNGGGTTKELVAEYAGTLDRFAYRASIADVRASGPFSRFDGYERHIMVIEGEGMTLDCGAQGVLPLAARFAPRTFSGDWDVVGNLIAGPVRDFNWIVDRTRAESSLEVRRIAARAEVHVPPRATCVGHVLEGALEGMNVGDTFVADAGFELVPTREVRIALGWYRPR